jgi:hypothetical protein
MTKQQKLNGDEPATQADLATWGGRLTERIDGVEARIDRLEHKLDTFKDDIIRHFNVVAENIHRDVAGANRDEISLMKDRITALEQHAGLTREG